MKKIDWGSFKGIRPINRDYGFGRGRPIDRYYIENLMAMEAVHVKGTVLEFMDDAYTRKYGGKKVRSSIVMATEKDKRTRPEPYMIFGDLGAKKNPLMPKFYDCIIATQVLQYMKRPLIALNNLYKALKPGGSLIGSWAVATRTHEFERKRWPFMMSVTAPWLRWALTRTFGEDNGYVREHGNVLVLTSFLWGLCVEDLNKKHLDKLDPDFPMILTFKAVKR